MIDRQRPSITQNTAVATVRPPKAISPLNGPFAGVSALIPPPPPQMGCLRTLVDAPARACCASCASTGAQGASNRTEGGVRSGAHRRGCGAKWVKCGVPHGKSRARAPLPPPPQDEDSIRLHGGCPGSFIGPMNQHVVELRGATLHMASTHQMQQTQHNDLTFNRQYVGG